MASKRRMKGDVTGHGKSYRRKVEHKKKIGAKGRETGKNKDLVPSPWDKLCAKYPKRAMRVDMVGYVRWCELHDGNKNKRK